MEHQQPIRKPEIQLPHTKKPFSAVESLCLENLLYYLIDKYGFRTIKSYYPDLWSGGTAVSHDIIDEIMNRLKSRNFLSRPKEAETVTYDLRTVFKKKDIDLSNPKKTIKEFGKKGINRLVYPYHWLTRPYGNIEIARHWIRTAHKYDMEVLLYTGPFGTELKNFLKDKPESTGWLQRYGDQSPATYDKKGNLLMFCPSSPYLPVYRLPIILNFIRITGCDGIFFDIPWMLSGACHCKNCMNGNQKFIKDAALGFKEQVVRDALSYAVLIIRSEFPTTWLAVNAAAPGIWDSSSIGATPAAMNGLFDEMVVEWTPSSAEAISNISRSVDMVRSKATGCRVSHAWVPEKSRHLNAIIEAMHDDQGIGKWY